jgi:hypothetical protein
MQIATKMRMIITVAPLTPTTVLFVTTKSPMLKSSLSIQGPGGISSPSQLTFDSDSLTVTTEV